MELLKDMMFGFEVQARAKKIDLRLDGEPEIPITTDSHRLRQIMMNILGNAVKFTPEGGRITVSAHAQGRQAAITVRDTGIGLTPEQAASLFHPYAQAGSHISKQFGGTGLGLMLAKKIAQSLGGDIRLVDAAIGKGCCFEIRISNGMDTLARDL
ncbi:MAG: hypothetical protein KF802_01700 [Bdellovibrionaceae bacterium]|nr:hypothetical protein [Pseudobdellovibrionaceae bacterium]